MITVRQSQQRGYADHGWLKSYHTFSFSSYYDPNHMGFRSLRVMNEDRVAAGEGFGTHPHKNMEIVSYVLDGELEHKDSMGNGEVLRPGEFQRITAGTGITHSEFNPSPENATHFYQIWLLPETDGLDPSYEQKSFDAKDRENKLQLVASQDAASGSLLIHQDAKVYLSELTAGGTVDYQIPADRHVWLQVLRGELTVSDQTLSAGDAAAISEEEAIAIRSATGAELMLFDLA